MYRGTDSHLPPFPTSNILPSGDAEADGGGDGGGEGGSASESVGGEEHGQRAAHRQPQLPDHRGAGSGAPLHQKRRGGLQETRHDAGAVR